MYLPHTLAAAVGLLTVAVSAAWSDSVTQVLQEINHAGIYPHLSTNLTMECSYAATAQLAALSTAWPGLSQDTTVQSIVDTITSAPFLDEMCSASFEATIKNLGGALQLSCGSQPILIIDKRTRPDADAETVVQMDVSMIIDLLAVVRNIACIKTETDSGYCLTDQYNTIKATIPEEGTVEALATTFTTNTELMCSFCMFSQVKAASNITGPLYQHIHPMVEMVTAYLNTTCAAPPPDEDQNPIISSGASASGISNLLIAMIFGAAAAVMISQLI
ncbi:hypothetical protein BSLG_007984 [Batrachochytrium salamandrivorans]|nr:hypothetical protein BASA62_000438 [Batrachochytrium salamandrivorans]KAH9254712.1 hypothetical protein BASA81_007263 [Batrachochytrium salamandrivorans]KAJ1334829.1 hypothetical protein BSLG_007984 [Batrachochytrium salamandrivorans]